ncbi:hypothetical protein KY289_004154 [Solanum tuberosum]|nr:hypothetical protein KY289_004154 [Solanum tuberosum]
MFKWWNATCSVKLRPLFNAVPTFIMWQIWKRRNMIRHGGKMSVQGMMMEINRNLHYLAITRVVKWKLPNEGVYKCNSDGASKGNPGPSKTQMEAANQAKIDVSEAKMKGEIGAKEREGLTRQNAAKIDAETKIISTQRDGDGKKEEVKVKTDVKIYENQREAEVAEANSVLATKKAG